MSALGWLVNNRKAVKEYFGNFGLKKPFDQKDRRHNVPYFRSLEMGEGVSEKQFKGTKSPDFCS